MISDAKLDEIEQAESGYEAGKGGDSRKETILMLVRELRAARLALAEHEGKKKMLRSDAGGRVRLSRGSG